MKVKASRFCLVTSSGWVTNRFSTTKYMSALPSIYPNKIPSSKNTEDNFYEVNTTKCSKLNLSALHCYVIKLKNQDNPVTSPWRHYSCKYLSGQIVYKLWAVRFCLATKGAKLPIDLKYELRSIYINRIGLTTNGTCLSI